MTITVFGASGKVGRLVTEFAVERGHNVVAFTHSGKAMDHKSVVAFKGDIHKQSDVESAIKDADAVICALGSWGTPEKDIVSTATRHLVPLLEKRTLRFVSVTGNVASPPSEHKSIFFRAARSLFSVLAGKIVSDADEHLKLLEESSVKWTSVRSPVMTGGETRGFKLVDKTPLTNLFISRRAVATALLDLIDSDEWVGKAPTIIKR